MPISILKPELLSCRRLAHLARAMLVRFPDDNLVTGYLLNARVVDGRLEGHLYKHLWRVRRDGLWITTGEIAGITEYSGCCWVVRTNDDDLYVVADFHPHGGRQSLRYLAEQFESAARTGSRWCVH